VLICAVADGAGSAARGGTGARIAVEAALGVATGMMEASIPDRLWAALEAAIAALLETAESLGTTPEDFATTLIMAIAMPTALGVIQVGDGGVVVAAGTEGDVELFTNPPRSEYANETTFLTCVSAMDSAQLRVTETAVRGFAIFTDGLQRACLQLGSDPRPHLGFFLPVFGWVAQSPSVTRLEHLLHLAPGDDDKTLILAHTPWAGANPATNQAG
jgi:hypothetical protein